MPAADDRIGVSGHHKARDRIGDGAIAALLPAAIVRGRLLSV
jgi:hypothetical protein